jgi:hypothetical protein
MSTSSPQRALIRNSWSEHWRRFAGWPATLALLIAALALLVQWFWLPSVLSDTAQIKSRTLARIQSEQSRKAVPTSHDAALAFFAALPTRASHLSDVKSIYAQASESRLTIHKAEYSFEAEPDGKLVRLKAIVPVGGNYRQVRNYLAQMLNNNPHLALEAIHMERQDATQEALQSRLHLSYLYRGE